MRTLDRLILKRRRKYYTYVRICEKLDINSPMDRHFYNFYEFLASLRGHDDLATVEAEGALGDQEENES